MMQLLEKNYFNVIVTPGLSQGNCKCLNNKLYSIKTNLPTYYIRLFKYIEETILL